MPVGFEAEAGKFKGAPGFSGGCIDLSVASLARSKDYFDDRRADGANFSSRIKRNARCGVLDNEARSSFFEWSLS